MIAKGTLSGHEITATAINPGNWFGKTWLIELGVTYTPMFFVVEADNVSDAIDELAESEYGHLIVVEDDDLGDYPEDSRQYGPRAQVLDLSHLRVHGQERADMPFPCMYLEENTSETWVRPVDLQD